MKSICDDCPMKGYMQSGGIECSPSLCQTEHRHITYDEMQAEHDALVEDMDYEEAAHDT